jgi:hypothetical protein
MDTSINRKTFELLKEGTTTKIPTTVSYDADIDPLAAALDPNEPLQSGVTPKAVVTTGVEDLAGNPLDQSPTSTGSLQEAWFFTVSN